MPTRASSPSSVEAELLRLAHHGALARELRDDDAALVADLGGVDVLERLRRLLDGGDVQAALVRERGAADVGRVRPYGRVDHVGDEVRGLGEALELLVADDGEPHLELERRDDADQVGVAAALAVPVDGALHLAGAGLHGHQAAGDGAVASRCARGCRPATPGRAAVTSRTTSATNGGRLAPLVSHRQSDRGARLGGRGHAAQRVRRGRRARRRRSARRRRRRACPAPSGT